MYCDNCKMEVLDYGVDPSVLSEIGIELPDHICENKECKCNCK